MLKEDQAAHPELRIYWPNAEGVKDGWKKESGHEAMEESAIAGGAGPN